MTEKRMQEESSQMEGVLGVTKRGLIRAGAGGIAAVLAACAPGGEGAPAAGDAQGKVVWSARVNTDENTWEQNVVLPKMKEKFPKIDLSLETQPSNVWAVKLIASYAAGTPPDIHHGFAGIVISLYAQGNAMELTPYIKRDKFDLAPFGGLQNDPDMCRSGKMYELPIDSGLGTMLFYNQSMLQQAGVSNPPTNWKDKSWTWDKALEAMTKTTKNWGEANAVYGLYSASWNPWFQIFSYLWGGDPWPKDFYAQRHRPDQPVDERRGDAGNSVHPGPGTEIPRDA